MPNIGQSEPFSPPTEKIILYMDTSNTPNHRNSIPSPTTMTGSVDGNFHEFPWVRAYFEAFENIWAWHTPLIYHMREKMDILMVMADQLTQYEGQGWAHPLICHIWKKMDIRKVKVDHLTLLACLPYTLSLVSNLEVKVPKICAEHFGNVYFIQLIPN